MRPSSLFSRTVVTRLTAALFLGLSPAVLGATEPSPESLRNGALDDLFVLRDYRPGKNSFVESPERHTGVWTNQGFRYTLADLKGQIRSKCW